MASTDSGSAWSIADDRDAAARAAAETRNPSRHVHVHLLDGHVVPGLAWQWRTRPDGTREGLVVHQTWSDATGQGQWIDVHRWIPVEQLRPAGRARLAPPPPPATRGWGRFRASWSR